MASKAPEVTSAGSHVAIATGYAAGKIIEVGEAVPPGVPVTDPEGSGHWMVPVAEAPAPAEA